MSLIAKDKAGGFDPIPEDLHIAICYGIWDLGTQFSERWEKDVHKVVLTWELPNCRIQVEKEGGKVELPRAISKTYRLSLHKKSELRKDLESWRGKKFSDEELNGFDLKKVLGAPCQIQVLHNKIDDKVYSNISTIIKVPGGTPIKPENNLMFFSFEEKGNIPQGTPQWVIDLIKNAKEYKGMHSEGEENEEVPF